MGKLLFSVAIIFMLTGCEHKSNRILFDFVNDDSIVNYKIYHDSLVLSFPVGTKHKKWFFEFEIEDRDSALGGLVNHHAGTDYTVVNNRIVIPVSISDTIDLNKLKLALLAGQPDDGRHFTKAYHYDYPKEKGWYELEGNQIYFPRDSYSLITAPYTRNWKWYVIPDSLFRSKDSVFYEEQFARFVHDSMPRTNFYKQQ
jgi:hypothetical protein